MNKNNQFLEELVINFKNNSIQDNYTEIIIQVNTMLDNEKDLLYLPCQKSDSGDITLKTVIGNDDKKYLAVNVDYTKHGNNIDYYPMTFKEIFETVIEEFGLNGICLDPTDDHVSSESDEAIISRDYIFKMLKGHNVRKNTKNIE